jgi:hypothetical protein
MGHDAGFRVSLNTTKTPEGPLRHLRIEWLRGKATRRPSSCRHSVVRPNPLESRSQRLITDLVWIMDWCVRVSVSNCGCTQPRDSPKQPTFVSCAGCRPGNVNYLMQGSSYQVVLVCNTSRELHSRQPSLFLSRSQPTQRQRTDVEASQTCSYRESQGKEAACAHGRPSRISRCTPTHPCPPEMRSTDGGVGAG